MTLGNPLAAATIDLAVVAGVLYTADRVFDPLPLPAALAVAAGLLALWSLGGARSGLALLVTVAGVVAGAALHLNRHLAGASPHPSEGLLFHILPDAMAGLFVALMALSATLAVRGLLEWHRSKNRADTP